MTDKITVEVNVTVNEPQVTPELKAEWLAHLHADTENLKPYTQTDADFTHAWMSNAAREDLRKRVMEPVPQESEGQPMTLEEARGYLARAVLTKGPDFIYRPLGTEWDDNPCSYFCRMDLPETDPRHDTPCLVGVAIRLAGREVTQDVEGMIVPSLASTWNLSEDAARYFRAAQVVQDDYRSWGEAYCKAEKYAERYATRDRADADSECLSGS